MPDQISAPIRNFLSWVAERPRSHADVMDAWQSSCPRLSVWEDASIAGLVRLEGRRVFLTPAGEAALAGDQAVRSAVPVPSAA